MNIHPQISILVEALHITTFVNNEIKCYIITFKCVRRKVIRHDGNNVNYLPSK